MLSNKDANSLPKRLLFIKPGWKKPVYFRRSIFMTIGSECLYRLLIIRILIIRSNKIKVMRYLFDIKVTPELSLNWFIYYLLSNV